MIAFTLFLLLSLTGRFGFDGPLPQGHKYYLSPNGNDSADGTSLKTAWKTFHQAQFALDAGDTLLVRGGSYPDTCFLPVRGGTSGRPITITAFNNEVPIVTGHGCWDLFFAIYHDWINVSGLTFENTTGDNGVIFVRQANHLSFRNNKFKNNKGASDIILDIANDVLIENNSFDTTGDPSGEGTGDNIYVIGSTHVLIQNNKLSRGGHAAIDLINDEKTVSAFNVVRDNTIDQYWGGGIYLTRGSHDNVVERNQIRHAGEGCTYPKVGLQIAADHNIVRYNVVDTTSVSPMTDNGINLEAYVFSGIVQNAIDNRIYNNDVYGAGRAALYVWINGRCVVARNKLVNNIFYRNKTAGMAEPYWPAGPYYLGFELYHTEQKWASFPGDNLFFNNLILHADAAGDHPGAPVIFYDGDQSRKSLREAQRSYPKSFSGNIERDPKFQNAPSGDFRLQAASPAINAGADLAHTTAAGQQTTQAVVDDASFFYDGYATVCGDSVKIGANTPVRIKSVNYASNTLTLERPISFDSGSAVNLAVGESQHPDMGAVPYGTPSASAQPACSVK